MNDFFNIRNDWFVSKVREIESTGISQAEIANRIGVKPQYLTPILSGKRNASERFVLKFCDAFGINQNELYKRMGEPVGLMSEEEMNQHDREVAAGKWSVAVADNKGRIISFPKDNQGSISPAVRSDEGIPLIPLDAVAGFCNGNSAQVLDYECDWYVVPSLRGAEFMLQVKGSSMYPKYSSGDIVACKRLPLDTFFQWNKVYVADTEQGVVIKRVMPGNDEDHIKMVSENERYPPFEIHKREITSLAIVIGVIRLE